MKSKRLYDALNSSKKIIEDSLSYLASKQNIKETVFRIDDTRLNDNKVNTVKFESIIEFKDGDNSSQKVIIFNTVLNKRFEIIIIRKNTPDVEIFTSDGRLIETVQTSLTWPDLES